MMTRHNFFGIILFLFWKPSIAFLTGRSSSLRGGRNHDYLVHSNEGTVGTRWFGTTPAKDSDPPPTGTPGATVGFIGTGTIASAIVSGMATQDAVPIDSIVVTRRSEAMSRHLAESFPTLVTVVARGADDNDDDDESNNQEILDRADLIFLTVLPEHASAVLRALSFDPERHRLVSLVSTAKLDDLVRDSKLDPSRVSKMICLPSVARHQGVCLHCANPSCAVGGGSGSSSSSDDDQSFALLTRLFDSMGGVVTLASEADLEVCMMTTVTMGPLYGMMKSCRDWLMTNTAGRLSQEEASYLVIKQCVGAVLDADDAEGRRGDTRRDPHRLETLIEEQTRGGLNEQALENVVRLGGFEGQVRVMDAVVSRIRGESNGSVN